MERQKIELYQERSFGEKLSATFAFVSENMQVLLKYLIYFRSESRSIYDGKISDILLSHLLQFF